METNMPEHSSETPLENKGLLVTTQRKHTNPDGAELKSPMSADLLSVVLRSEGPVSVDQIQTNLLDLCLETTLLNTYLKDGGKFLRKVEDIKEQITQHISTLKRYESLPTIQRALWELRRSTLVLSEKSKKYRKESFSTADSKRKRSEERLVDVNRAWQQLMMELTMAIAEKNTLEPDLATNRSPSPQSPGNQDEDDCVKLCVMGDKYLFGYGVQRSYDQAYKQYLVAAEKGHADGCNMVGCMLEYGLGRESNMAQAVRWYEMAAQKGQADAMNNLGRIYEQGKGVQKDGEVAFKYYMKAASDHDHADAQTNLGYLCEHGIGKEVNVVQAMSWYRLAAMKHDYARAQNYLGSLLYYGKATIKRNPDEAVKWFRRAAEQGNTHAQNNLGICYEEGVGVVKDFGMAKEFYRRSSEGNHPSAINNLGYIHLLEKNYDEAMRCFQLAAALGSVDALFNIGTCFEAGVLHPQRIPNLALAYPYYLRSAEKGYEKASLKVSECLLNGLGCETDPVAAAQWLKKCAEENDCPEAMNRLGQLWELGLGVERKDVEQARSYYTAAAAFNHIGALNNLVGLLENDPSGEQPSAANTRISNASLPISPRADQIKVA